MTRPKLLLADDSVTIRKVVELTFADEGIDVTAVADGDAAMSKFVEIQPDIVLVEVGLPGTTGYQICEMIKGDESTSHIPVLLLVGSFEPFDHDAAEKAGADGFLTKPFHSIRDLVNRVHELLGNDGRDTLAMDDDIPSISVEGEPADDDNDIEELYERSFAETMPIENYETVPAFTNEDTFEGSFDEQPPIENLDASHHSVDEWLDDEMIEAVSRSEEAVEGPASEEPVTAKEDVDDEAEAASHKSESSAAEPADEAVAAVSQYEAAPAAEVDIEPIKEFDWSPAAIVTAADDAEIGAAAGFAPAFVYDEPLIPSEQQNAEPSHEIERSPEDVVTELREEESNSAFETRAADVENETERESSLPEPSREFIDLIARRVVERLSDRAIREIAQEAVPRIAERLMREALEDEKK